MMMETIIVNKENYEKIIKDMLIWQKAYDEGHPVISDEQWDAFYFALIQMEKELGYVDPNSPTQKVIYSVINELQKVEHNHPMLSLDKTKDLNEIVSFIEGHDWICMAKMDGLTCSLTYRGGRLVRAETRGNGIVGEDITHNAYVIPSIPKTIPTQTECVIDGEVICRYENFKAFENNYSNPRNFAAGSIRLLDNKECEKRFLTFVAWDWVKGYIPHSSNKETNTLSHKLFLLNQLGFIVVPWAREGIEYGSNLDDRMKIVKGQAEKEGYPIDGLVFKYNNCEEYDAAGRTEHHFRGGLAYKFYDELYETELEDIEWSLGRTGVLTPVAKFKEIEIEGARVNRASLHNLSVMNEVLDHPYVGQKIRIFRANQIIPQVYDGELISEWDIEDFLIVPDRCPVCGEQLSTRNNDGVLTLWCTNKQCPGQNLYRLDHFCGKKGLDIKGLSEATLEKLMDWGWVETYTDIFYLFSHEKEWIMKPGFGEKSVKRVLDAIEAASHTTLAKFISAIGIPLIGTSVAKVLANQFKTWQDFRTAAGSGFKFYELLDFGPEKHAAITSFDYTEADAAAELLKFEEVKEEPKGATLEGLTFVITGKMTLFKNRTELKAFIESQGGRLVDSVSSKTSYLISNDPNSTTGKHKTATSLGIPIITEQQFKELLN